MNHWVYYDLCIYKNKLVGVAKAKKQQGQIYYIIKYLLKVLMIKLTEMSLCYSPFVFLWKGENDFLLTVGNPE